jgi:hypothetical protein
MKKLLIPIFLFMLSHAVSAQWSVNAVMGLDFRSAPSFRDYVNANYPSQGNSLQTFKSAASFSIEADYKIQENFEIGLQYNLLIDSYTTPVGIAGTYEISYSHHRPSLLAYYVIPGPGYQFKFGGGIGFRYVSLNEKVYSSSNYTASGVGLLLCAVGNTQLSKNFYALIGLDARYDAPGEVSNGSSRLVNNSIGENLNMNSISFGIYLGVTYTF